MNRRGDSRAQRWPVVLAGLLAAGVCVGVVPFLARSAEAAAATAPASVITVDIDGVGQGIPITSFDFGLSQKPPNPSASANAAKPTVSDITITKKADTSSSKLLRACAKGKHFPKATITLRTCSAQDCSQSYLEITMSDVLISSYQTGGSSGDEQPSESLSLNFTKVEMEFVQDGVTVGLTKRGGSWVVDD